MKLILFVINEIMQSHVRESKISSNIISFSVFGGLLYDGDGGKGKNEETETLHKITLLCMS